MRFIVQSSRAFPSSTGPRAAILVPDSWDDFIYRTSYDLWIRLREDATPTEIGRVKIALANQGPGPSPLPVGTHEDGLPSALGSWISLGQDSQYYEEIKQLGPELSNEILTGLHDLAFDLRAFRRFQSTNVARASLLRSISGTTVVTQFHRIATGGERLSGYRFGYHPPQTAPSSPPRGPLEFKVTPESSPPTNIHVLIGRNGEGKTTLLRSLANAAVRPISPLTAGWIEHLPNEIGEPQLPFANVLLVAFSAFDPFNDITPPSPATRYTHIGLVPAAARAATAAEPAAPRQPPRRLKRRSDLADEFVDSLRSIMTSGHHERWRSALETLGNDRQFKATVLEECEVTLLRHPVGPGTLLAGPDRLWRDVFMDLSSGHAMVLLTLTRLVELVAERTLVLLDEPESHLHPPLLSSFIRAVSDLLTDRNGVAVTATHSPVVLQEVPKSCVYKITRNGRHSRARRPRSETYGENVGVLTHEIFGLEVMQSGFYAEIEKAVHDFGDYEAVINHFDGQLGDEARGLVRILLADREEGER
ncbi:AAA family ATPase [Streptomyces sp. NPDC127110]|uniref:AAA family ATPase n=1 Tax=Streptomyces sp. NPDC127110 TaxID=3345362 RepID=UPI0036311424